MNIHVARNGEFTEEKFRDKVFRGEVRSDDSYWTAGMEDWQSVAAYWANARTQVIRGDLPRNPGNN
jgi:GYF domain 2